MKRKNCEEKCILTDGIMEML